MRNLHTLEGVVWNTYIDAKSKQLHLADTDMVLYQLVYFLFGFLDEVKMGYEILKMLAIKTESLCGLTESVHIESHEKKHVSIRKPKKFVHKAD